MNKLFTAIVFASTIVLQGCAIQPINTSGQIANTPYQNYRQAQVRYGNVAGIRNVVVAGQSSGVGMASGAVVGGVAGHQIGKGRGKTVATILGVIAGGAVGNAVEQQGNTRPALELTVIYPNGEVVVVTQPLDNQVFRIGDRVQVSSDGYSSRVVQY
jgi:outer membrane lipoprotein SlyB